MELGGASRNSTGFGAMEEGPHDKLRQEPQGSSPGFECAGSDSDRRVPAELGLCNIFMSDHMDHSLV